MRIDLPPTKENDILDITDIIREEIARSNIKDGAILLFIPGSTGALSTLEYEPGLVEDIPLAMERLFPKGIRYHHDDTWHDGNGHSHVRATVMGPSLTIPIENGELTLGTWQQIVLLEFDNKPRKRQLVIKFLN